MCARVWVCGWGCMWVGVWGGGVCVGGGVGWWGCALAGVRTEAVTDDDDRETEEEGEEDEVGEKDENGEEEEEEAEEEEEEEESGGQDEAGKCRDSSRLSALMSNSWSIGHPCTVWCPSSNAATFGLQKNGAPRLVFKLSIA